MHLFTKITNKILNTSNVYLIVAPTRRLLYFLFVLFVIGAFLVSLMFSSLMIIAAPLLLFYAYFYYLFCHLWRSYRFSVFYLVMTPLLEIASGIGLSILMF